MKEQFFPPAMLDTGDFVFRQMLGLIRPQFEFLTKIEPPCGCFGVYIAYKNNLNWEHYNVDNGKNWFQQRLSQFAVDHFDGVEVLGQLAFNGMAPLPNEDLETLKYAPYAFGARTWTYEPRDVMERFNAWIEKNCTS